MSTQLSEIDVSQLSTPLCSIHIHLQRFITFLTGHNFAPQEKKKISPLFSDISSSRMPKAYYLEIA